MIRKLQEVDFDSQTKVTESKNVVTAVWPEDGTSEIAVAQKITALDPGGKVCPRYFGHFVLDQDNRDTVREDFLQILDNIEHLDASPEKLETYTTWIRQQFGLDGAPLPALNFLYQENGGKGLWDFLEETGALVAKRGGSMFKQHQLMLVRSFTELRQQRARILRANYIAHLDIHHNNIVVRYEKTDEGKPGYRFRLIDFGHAKNSIEELMQNHMRPHDPLEYVMLKAALQARQLLRQTSTGHTLAVLRGHRWQVIAGSKARYDAIGDNTPVASSQDLQFFKWYKLLFEGLDVTVNDFYVFVWKQTTLAVQDMTRGSGGKLTYENVLPFFQKRMYGHNDAATCRLLWDDFALARAGVEMCSFLEKSSVGDLQTDPEPEVLTLKRDLQEHLFGKFSPFSAGAHEVDAAIAWQGVREDLFASLSLNDDDALRGDSRFAASVYPSRAGTCLPTGQLPNSAIASLGTFQPTFTLYDSSSYLWLPTVSHHSIQPTYTLHPSFSDLWLPTVSHQSIQPTFTLHPSSSDLWLPSVSHHNIQPTSTLHPSRDCPLLPTTDLQCPYAVPGQQCDVTNKHPIFAGCTKVVFRGLSGHKTLLQSLPPHDPDNIVTAVWQEALQDQGSEKEIACAQKISQADPDGRVFPVLYQTSVIRGQPQDCLQDYLAILQNLRQQNFGQTGADKKYQRYEMMLRRQFEDPGGKDRKLTFLYQEYGGTGLYQFMNRTLPAIPNAELVQEQKLLVDGFRVMLQEREQRLCAAGIAHLDIHSDNVVLQKRQSGVYCCRLIDFGFNDRMLTSFFYRSQGAVRTHDPVEMAMLHAAMKALRAISEHDDSETIYQLREYNWHLAPPATFHMVLPDPVIRDNDRDNLRENYEILFEDSAYSLEMLYEFVWRKARQALQKLPVTEHERWFASGNVHRLLPEFQALVYGPDLRGDTKHDAETQCKLLWDDFQLAQVGIEMCYDCTTATQDCLGMTDAIVDVQDLKTDLHRQLFGRFKPLLYELQAKKAKRSSQGGPPSPSGKKQRNYHGF